MQARLQRGTQFIERGCCHPTRAEDVLVQDRAHAGRVVAVDRLPARGTHRRPATVGGAGREHHALARPAANRLEGHAARPARAARDERVTHVAAWNELQRLLVDREAQVRAQLLAQHHEVLVLRPRWQWNREILAVVALARHQHVRPECSDHGLRILGRRLCGRVCLPRAGDTAPGQQHDRSQQAMQCTGTCAAGHRAQPHGKAGRQAGGGEIDTHRDFHSGPWSTDCRLRPRFGWQRPPGRATGRQACGCAQAARGWSCPAADTATACGVSRSECSVGAGEAPAGRPPVRGR